MDERSQESVEFASTATAWAGACVHGQRWALADGGWLAASGREPAAAAAAGCGKGSHGRQHVCRGEPLAVVQQRFCRARLGAPDGALCLLLIVLDLAALSLSRSLPVGLQLQCRFGVNEKSVLLFMWIAWLGYVRYELAGHGAWHGMHAAFKGCTLM